MNRAEKTKAGVPQKRYDRTMRSCFASYVVQAVVNNFAPLLFVTFHERFGIPLSKITLLVTFNFLLQLLIDAASVKFLDRIGYRAAAVLANVCAGVGLAMLAILPGRTADPFAALLIAVTVMALGGGLLEVVISPIVEACPSDGKERAMSMLHSFYCWGHVGVVLLSTLFFAAFGLDNWRIMAGIWAALPLVVAVSFLNVPIERLLGEGERGMRLAELAKSKVFWLMFAAMLCSGAGEQSVSQWASVLAEKGLGVSKALGDLTGPMLFAICMGMARLLYGKFGDRIPLRSFMLGSCGLCVFAYLVIGLAPVPALGLIGCGICGFSVGIFWPGTLSLTSAALPRGGTALFCLLALAGDLGCSAGPTLAGMVSSAFGDNIRMGILAAVLFPALLMLCIWRQKRVVARERGK